MANVCWLERRLFAQSAFWLGSIPNLDAFTLAHGDSKVA
jgi:hypothetical protein